MSPPFAAVLLAGGRSRRMGQDKAMLPLPDGRRLWERQLAVLRALGPAELFISGPVREGFPSDVPVLADEIPGLGPLAGIAAALRAMRTPRLVVLAVDLPTMTTAFLHGLLTEEQTVPSTRGTVPQAADGFFEPLAAIYAQPSLVWAEAQLRSGNFSLQAFVRLLIDNKLAVARPVADAEADLFTNWNQPRDVPS